MYHPEAVDDDELDDLIFEYTTRPSTNLKETIREIRGSKDRDANLSELTNRFVTEHYFFPLL